MTAKATKATARRGLTPKRAKFVAEYLLDLSATQAAIRAGFSKRSAGTEGARLLKNAEIKAAISTAMQVRADRTGVTQDRVLEELARIGFSDMRTFAAWGPGGVTLVDHVELEDDAARCVAEVSQSVSKDGGSIKFKLHDKVGALEKIGKHLGMFVEKHEHGLTASLEQILAASNRPASST